jgi:thiamine biosynthesis lipoprotein
MRARPLLGTLVEVRAASIEPRGFDPERAVGEETRLHAAIEAALAQIERVHRLMSCHDPDSELSRLNRCGPGRAQRVDPRTYHVVTAAVEFARLSGGAFDPCVADTLADWGYLPNIAGGSDRTSRGASWEDIELLTGNRIRLKHPLRLDLGGIAKGYAVDLAVRMLQCANVREILVNAGGDIRVAGTRTREVFLRHPLAPTTGVNPLQLRNGALASSAAYFSRRTSANGDVSALLDPRTRAPYIGNDTVSIRANDCMTADALTKVVLFASPTIAERMLDEFRAEAFVLKAPCERACSHGEPLL